MSSRRCSRRRRVRLIYSCGSVCLAFFDFIPVQYRDKKVFVVPSFPWRSIHHEGTKRTKERIYSRKERKRRKEFRSQFCRGNPLWLPFSKGGFQGEADDDYYHRNPNPSFPSCSSWLTKTLGPCHVIHKEAGSPKVFDSAAYRSLR